MSMINIGLSGALANKVALNVTASNTANATNGDYSRQVVDMSTAVNKGQFNGVQVDTIKRIANSAYTNQVRIGTQQYAYSNALYVGASAVEDLLGMESLDINTGMTELLSAFSQASVDPQSNVYRSQILIASEDIADRFNQISSQLNEQISSAVSLQHTTVKDANIKLASIAALNKQISEASVSGSDTNALMDSLDKQLNELAENLDFNVLHKDDGSVELSTDSGAPLLVGQTYGTLYAGAESGDENDISIGVNFQGQTFSAGDNVGGVLGANIDLVNKHIHPTLNHLNDIASALATSINDSLTSGIDLNGNDGQPLFEFDPNNAASTLKVADLENSELALASKPDGYDPATDSEEWLGNADIATSISNLATTATSVGGVNETLFDSYSDLVGNVGLRVKQAEGNTTAAYSQLNAAQTKKNNVSGVNSDEEAVNLITYMNAYQANMKVISTAQDMFSTVINAF